jgi:predicted O-linked N-acetylglucosamine transferase (SPINDLY family)
MGIDELIANSAKDYVALANRLANDKEFHAEMSGLISQRAGKFFENMDTVRELERFMIAAIEAEQKGDGHISWNEP